MNALCDTFGHAKRAIGTFEPTFWTVKRDYAWFVAEQRPNDGLTKVPFFRNLVNRVVNLKCTHSQPLTKSVLLARIQLYCPLRLAIFFPIPTKPTTLTSANRLKGDSQAP